MGKASEIWKEIKPKIGEMLMAVNNIETQAEKAQEEAYQKGLSDAWECVDRINSMSHKEQEECFGRTYLVNILELEPSEAIEKIRAYEQEKEEQIHVGDEVIPYHITADSAPVIVTRKWKDDYEQDAIDTIGYNGAINAFLVEHVKKTGKHFEIAEVLQKMKEE